MEITMSNAGPRLSAILKEWGNRFSFPKKSKAAPAGGLETVAEQAANDVPSPLAEAMGARLARYGYRSLALGLGGVFMVFVTGPFDDHFTKLAKEDVLGNVYREAKSHSLAVAKATDFKSLKEKSAELKIWSDKQGKEHLALKPGGKLEDVHALMHVSILLDSGIEDFNKGAQDENFTAYKLKKAASDFPTNAFMKEKSTLESVKWKWILSLTLLIAVTLSAYSYFSEKAKKPDGGRTSSAAAMIGGLIGGLIGGSLVAALYVNYALGNLIG